MNFKETGTEMAVKVCVCVCVRVRVPSHACVTDFVLTYFEIVLFSPSLLPLLFTLSPPSLPLPPPLQKIPVPELRINDKDNIVELAVVMGTGTCPDIVEYYGCLIREVSSDGVGGSNYGKSLGFPLLLWYVWHLL